MKPEQYPRTARRATQAARALMRLHIDWLRGFPVPGVGGGWLVMPRPGGSQSVRVEQIDGAVLRKTTRALNELRRDHLPALKRLTRKQPHWWSRVKTLLTVLKPWAAGRDTMPAANEALPSPHELLRRLQAPRATSALDQLWQSAPVLRPLLRAVVWQWALREPELLRVLRWLARPATRAAMTALEGYAEDVLRPALDAAGVMGDAPLPVWLLLALSATDLVARLGPARLDPVLALLAGSGPEAIVTMPVKGAGKVLMKVPFKRDHRRGPPPNVKWPRPDAEPLSLVLAKLLVQAQRRPDKQARRMLELTARLWPSRLAGDWRQWWRRYRDVQHEGRLALLQRHDRKDIAPLLESVQRLGKLEQHHPTVFRAGQTTATIAELVQQPDHVYRVIRRALDTLPDTLSKAVPARFAGLWQYMLRHDSARSTIALIDSARRFWEHCRPLTPQQWEQVLAPWARWLNRADKERYFMTPERLAQVEPRSAQLGRRMFAMFEQLYAEPELAPQVLASSVRQQNAAYIAMAVDEPALAAALFLALHHDAKEFNEYYLDEEFIALALLLSEAEPKRFARIVTLLCEADSNIIYLEERKLKLVRELCATPGAAALLYRCCEAGMTQRVVVMMRQAVLLRSLKEPLPPLRPAGGHVADTVAQDRGPPEDAALDAWLRHYPPALHAAVLAVVRVHGGDTAPVNKLLARAFPRPERLRRELASIAARLSRPAGAGQAERRQRLLKRQTNLCARLAAGTSRQAKRLDRYNTKLWALADQAVLLQWLAKAERRAHDKLCQELAVDALPEWVGQKPCAQLLPYLSALSRSPRRLAMQLLTARMGRYPWDLREAPANRAFVQEMMGRGLNMQPWLDGIGIIHHRTVRGDVYLQLERDPLEVMMMGYHFDTCLAPGSFNFFSAVTNAADINKRVLYARDIDGGVVGRCLLALSNEGRLLAFHVYCHDGSLKMDELVADFCERLTTRIGCGVTTRADVSCLLAKDWYNDGPRDLARAPSPLHQDSAFAKKLEHITAAELLGAIASLRPRVQLDARTLPLLLDLPAMEKRPELVVPLIEVVRGRRLATSIKAHIAQRALAAGAEHDAQALLLSDVVPVMERDARRGIELPPPTLGALIELGCASRVLRCLRQTRPRKIRSWVQDSDERLYLVARAHAALHRRKLALRLLRTLLARKLEPPLRQTAQQLSERLV